MAEDTSLPRPMDDPPASPVRYRVWPPALWPADAVVVDRAHLRIARLDGLHQGLASGALAAAASVVGARPPGLGLFQASADPRCAVRIARDRLLLVSPDPLALEAGWQAAGFAYTPLDDGLAVFEMNGAAVPDLLRTGTAIDPDASSPCAALQFGGFAAIVYRCQGRWRFHIERGLATAFQTWLRQASEELA